MNADSITIAYIAIGVSSSGLLNEAEHLASRGLPEGQFDPIELIQIAIDMAEPIDQLFEVMNRDSGFAGCFAYDVALPMGDWYVRYIAKHGAVPARSACLSQAAQLIAKQSCESGFTSCVDLTDTDAMDQIHSILSGQEWDSDTPELIAQVVMRTCRTIGPNEVAEGSDQAA